MQRPISTGKLDRLRNNPGCWFLTAGVVYYFCGLETKGTSIARIGRELATA